MLFYGLVARVPNASLFHCPKQDYAYQVYINIILSIKSLRRGILRVFVVVVCFLVLALVSSSENYPN